MSTKTATKVITAWKNGCGFRCGNTRTDGKSVYLFGKEIIKREGNKVFIRTCGYPLKTTKDRLNEVHCVMVHTRKGVLFLNGKEWENHEEWTEVI